MSARPKPIEDKVLAGNPGKRPLNVEAPDYEVDEKLPCPAALKGKAREEWVRLAPMLVEHGTLRKPDLRAFEEFCAVIGELDSYKKKAENETSPRMKMAYQDMVIKLRTQFRLMATELGLTPSSRGSIKAIRTKGKNTGAKTDDALKKVGANVRRFFKLPSST